MISKEKKIWCKEEDETLRTIYEDQGEKSWSVIAKRLYSQFNFPRKSAKQCRERYENHICSQDVCVEWNEEEENKLIELHNEMGNKWSLIAHNIPGKTDNCVKNRFYSKLRKVLRKLNSIIHAYLKKEYRQINIGTLYKIVEATQQCFKEDPSCGYQVSEACRGVQNRMLHISMLKEEQYDSQETVKIYSNIIKDIYAVSKLYKRKSKKIRNSAIQAPNAKRKKQRESNIIVKTVEEQGYASDSSSVFDEEEEAVKKQKKPQIVVEEAQEGIRDMLKDHGLLKQEQGDANKSVFRFSCKSSFKSYSQNNNFESDNQFFEDSELEKGLNSRRKGSYFRYRSGLFDDPSDRSEREGPDLTLG